MTRSRLTTCLTAALVLLTTLVAGVLLGAPAASAASAPRATSPTAAPVVFVGTGGLTWSDVSPTGTPALWSLLRTGATASLTVRSVHSNTCPVDGWLTLSAGERAGDRDTGSDTRPPCRALREPAADGAVPGWDTYRRIAAGKDFDARIGLLGDELTRGVGCVRAVGPGAALAASTSAGRVTGYAPYDARTLPRTLSACRATLVDVGAVRDPAEVDPRDEVRPSAPRAAQVRAVDARIGQVLAAAPRNADVLVGSLSDAGASERLRLAALRGPGVRPGTLESTSTRQDGLIQLADLTATILARAGLPDPAGVSGNPLRAVPADDTSEAAAADRLQHLVDYDQASHEVHALVPPFFNAWVDRADPHLRVRRGGVAAPVGVGGHPAAAAAPGPAGGDHRGHRAGVDLPGQPAALVALRQPDARRRGVGRRCSSPSSRRSPCSARGAGRCSGRPRSCPPPRCSSWPPT